MAAAFLPFDGGHALPSCVRPVPAEQRGLSTAQHHAALASCSPRLRSQQLSSEQPFVPHGPSGSGSPHPASLESHGFVALMSVVGSAALFLKPLRVPTGAARARCSRSSLSPCVSRRRCGCCATEQPCPISIRDPQLPPHPTWVPMGRPRPPLGSAASGGSLLSLPRRPMKHRSLTPSALP